MISTGLILSSLSVIFLSSFCQFMPLSAPHQGYDSVAGGPHTPLQRGPGTNQSRLHVVYRANQTYPRFLVTLEAFYDFAAYLSEVLCVILSDYNLICSALAALRTYKSICPRALLSVRVPCRKKTNPKSAVTPRTTPRTPVQRFAPTDVKADEVEI